ncbi:hypothetical protein C4M97_02905 [Mycoplasmopsis pullorum]|uniref:MHJ_0274 family protein n=3 Tax=Mycoplasmopsis pullorum TaxID=48003 RepID=UPI0011182DCE|nr:hypothetical protein [Mycoplasmopsis pullorum]TNK82808.1 hypothetical protein C4M93_03490 [Mycoplasmopsis pullorum]TNK83313.1 hypothetical protein C4M80_00655 [Mycoplasmopsis pullorum]TNK84988.1 hypothetical protein C4M92_02610 [Mycoplasmopsis pullorum]TNK86312.1 hypothetical protein C4M85_00390 [Mycoplasmopsis pullorum]TNK86716.1 hypothetical protein C4M82_02350 [Mycoplasmopsis pullorum]
MKYLYEAAESTTSSSNSFGNFLSQYAMYLILGFVVVVLVVFFIVVTIKDKINKRKLLKEKEEFNKEVERQYEKLILKLNALIQVNEEHMNNFQVSIGEHTMSELTVSAKTILEDIVRDPDFQLYLLNNDQSQKIVKFVVQLKDNKSNLWTKKQAKLIEEIQNELQKIEIADLEAKQEQVLSEVRNEFNSKLLKKPESTK